MKTNEQYHAIPVQLSFINSSARWVLGCESVDGTPKGKGMVL